MYMLLSQQHAYFNESNSHVISYYNKIFNEVKWKLENLGKRNYVIICQDQDDHIETFKDESLVYRKRLERQMRQTDNDCRVSNLGVNWIHYINEIDYLQREQKQIEERKLLESCLHDKRLLNYPIDYRRLIISGSLKMPLLKDIINERPTNNEQLNKIQKVRKFYGFLLLDYSRRTWHNRLRQIKAKQKKRQIQIFLEKAGKANNALCDNGYWSQLYEWRKKVLSLAGIFCWCGEKAIQVHHLFYRCFYPELSLNVNNGMPLCKQHHYEVHGKRLRQ